jgi:hypothetical protein
MNFPATLIKSQQFKLILQNLNNVENNNNFYDPSIKFHQELAKKLYEKNESIENLYSNIENWLKSLKYEKLIKICSINNKWFLDILHQMIILDKKTTNVKFIFQSNFNNNSNNRYNSYYNKDQNNKEINNFPNYNNYFSMRTSSLIQISKNLSKHNEISNEFINEIRYLSIKSKELQNENNNILTFSYDLLNNIDKLLDYFKEISNEKCFSEIIEINKILIENEKYFYNFNLPKWFQSKNFFTLSELICSYFEQIILINYQYEKNYNNNEIIFPYDSDFNNFIDNNQKIYESMNKINIFKQIDFKKIENEIKSNEKINEEINKRSKIDEFIIKNYTNSYLNNKIKTIEEQINDIYLFLYKIFEYGDKKFIISLIFITDDKIFTVNDFVFKKVFEQINEQFNIKINNDLIQEKIENKKKKRKKKKKKKKNNNENSNEIENEIKNEIKDENNNNIIKNNENSNEINSILKNEKEENKNNLIEKKEDINNIH